MIKSNKSKIYSAHAPIRNYLFIIFCFIIFLFFLQKNLIKNKCILKENNENLKKEKINFDVNFRYDKYENNFLTDKIIQDSGWLLNLYEANFINGLIRKLKPKNCLEIGVANGGSAILILNAIKDIQNSCLVSLDLNNKLYFDNTKKVGYRVKEYFPELAKNWKLFTGDQPHKFLVKLNMKFDFLFLDSAHIAPGELINFIEALPFMNENAIVVMHDILWQFKQKEKIYPSNIHLYPAIYGNKILLRNNDIDIGNIAAVILSPNQKSHYLEYFLLLLTLWEYMPTDKQINDLRIFIKDYFKNDFYLKIFDIAVEKNRISIENHKIYNLT